MSTTNPREVNIPFYFAIPRWAAAEQRAKAPDHIASTFGVRGRIEHVRSEPSFRLYRVMSA